MAYNKNNMLMRILDIQNLYLEHNRNGVSGEYIYSRIVYPVYRISRATFYNYLSINAKKQIKEVNKQLSLFAD